MCCDGNHDLLDTAAILVTGGLNDFNLDVSGGVLSAVEVLHSDGSPWCSLPDLPDIRRAHTQTGLEACGGFGRTADESLTSTCVRFSGGSWSPSHELVVQMWLHSSWASPAGTVLMGGYFSPQSTELLDETTEDSVTLFPLKYDTQ